MTATTSLGNCAKCQLPLEIEPCWTHFQMHQRCFEEQRRVNDYANDAIKRDQINRAEGRY